MKTRLAKKKKRSVQRSRNGLARTPLAREVSSVSSPQGDPQEFRRSDPVPPSTSFPMPMLTWPPECQSGLVQSPVPDYQPFPVDCFPRPVRDYIAGHAQVLNCDPAVVALPVLAVLASAAGDRRIQIKQSWTEPANLWTALIADGQTCHAAALQAATAPLVQRESQEFERQRQLMPEYERLMTRYRADLRQARKEQGIEPDRPAVPHVERSVAADWTLPSLIRLLAKQQRGLLVCARDIDGWLGRSLGSGSRASLDRQAWFDLHAGQSVTIESRSDRPPIHLDPVPVSVTGSLSEDLLIEKLTKACGPCGLASRLLFASPPTQPRRWTDDDVGEAVTDEYAAVIDLLIAAGGALPADAGAERTPTLAASGTMVLAPAARDCFVAFMQDLSTMQRGIDDVLFAWSSNLAGQAARLALVVHLTRWAAGEADDATVCDLASMQRGIALARWFAFEAQRVATRLSLELELRDDLRLVDWLRRRGGKATPRDLCRSNRRKYPTLELAIDAFGRLAETGLTDWTPRDPGPQGGRPTRELVLPGSPDNFDAGLLRSDQDSREPVGESDCWDPRVLPRSLAGASGYCIDAQAQFPGGASRPMTAETGPTDGGQSVSSGAIASTRDINDWQRDPSRRSPLADVPAARHRTFAGTADSV
ncbi:MAG: DUF3987 domain-containing protein [Planctomycetes bacterium]|nr:DUF3987 domain-containing protein [Planctomycetota bacterium]